MSAISDMFAEGEFKLKIRLSDEEIAKKQAEYFINKAKIYVEDQILADAKAHYKTQTAPMIKTNEELFIAVHEGYEIKKVRALETINEDTQTIDYLDPENPDVVLDSRDMTPSEKTQYKIKFTRNSREMSVQN